MVELDMSSPTNQPASQPAESPGCLQEAAMERRSIAEWPVAYYRCRTVSMVRADDG
jgi:hypothetical protein